MRKKDADPRGNDRLVVTFTPVIENGETKVRVEWTEITHDGKVSQPETGYVMDREATGLEENAAEGDLLIRITRDGKTYGPAVVIPSDVFKANITGGLPEARGIIGTDGHATLWFSKLDCRISWDNLPRGGATRKHWTDQGLGRHDQNRHKPPKIGL